MVAYLRAVGDEARSLNEPNTPITLGQTYTRLCRRHGLGNCPLLRLGDCRLRAISAYRHRDDAVLAIDNRPGSVAWLDTATH